MNSILNLLRRALALYAVRCLEIQLQDQTNALQHVSDLDTIRAIAHAKRQTQQELLAARSRYISQLAPGDCPTWRLA